MQRQNQQLPQQKPSSFRCCGGPLIFSDLPQYALSLKVHVMDEDLKNLARTEACTQNLVKYLGEH